MKLLLDTCTFLWFTGNSPKLSSRARQLIGDLNNETYLSVVSAWEIGIKVSIGKMNLLQPVKPFIATQLTANRMKLLPLELDEIERISQMPLHHKDPFDRVLAAQSLVHGMPLISIDPKLDLYQVKRIW